MESNGKIGISIKYEKEDYLNLNLNKSSSSIQWEKAIDIFDDRIKNRFLMPLESLNSNIKSNGFIIMAIDCLLIETLLQFKEGLKDSKSSDYKNFLKSEFPDVFDEESSNKFYKGIRCGILHSAQTKYKTRLTDNMSYIAQKKGEVWQFSVKQITLRLRKYINEYEQKLLDPNELELRSKFIEKMNDICKGTLSL